MQAPRARCLLAAAMLLLAGCPPPPVARPYPPPTAGELLQAITTHSRSIHSLRAEARVEHQIERGQRIKVTISLLLARGGKLRLEAQAPIGGGTVATLVADGNRFALLDSRNNRFLQGPAKGCNVARLIRIALEPEEVVEVLTGGVPIQGEPQGVSWDAAHGGREVLELRTPDGGKERIWLDSKDRLWDVLEAERRDAHGKIIWHLSHSGFATHDQVRLPQRTEVEEPPVGAGARLKFRELEPNVPEKEELFQLTPPPGMAVEPSDC
jgi:outer membrane lipoprotein-sorting protein